MRLKYLAWLIIPAILFTTGCPKPDPDEPNIVIHDDPKECPAACEHAEELRCAEAQPLVFKETCEIDADCKFGICVEGQCTETCVMTCEGLINEGIALGLVCWQNITNCKQIESDCR